MLRISDRLTIPDQEIELSAIRASGPGGQNVNKVASAIHLRFDIANSSLPETCKRRLLDSGDRRISKDGVAIIKAQRYRDQEKNRIDALERLEKMIKAALHRPKARIATRPGVAAKKRRMDAKSRRGRIKALRGKIVERD